MSGQPPKPDGLAFYSQFIQQGALCFDIGAHRGSKTDLFLGLGARVVCVEPQPRCVQILTEKYQGHPGVAIVPKGLAAAAGVRPIHVCEAADTISTFSARWQTGRFRTYRWDSSVDVPVTTLDELIAEFGSPLFCKIDVEGSETEVIRGLSTAVPVMAFEFTSEFIRDATDCVRHLQALGYSEFNYTRGESFGLSSPAWMDAPRLFQELSWDRDPLAWGDIYARLQS